MGSESSFKFAGRTRGVGSAAAGDAVDACEVWCHVKHVQLVCFLVLEDQILLAQVWHNLQGCPAQRAASEDGVAWSAFGYN
jgi:hypothetical protein